MKGVTVLPKLFENGECRHYPWLDWFPITDDETRPHGRTNVEREQLRAVCDACPVRKLCLDWALAHEKFGFWGGATEGERRKLRRERGIKFHSPEPQFRGTVTPPTTRCASSQQKAVNA